MRIEKITHNKKRYLDLLLLADEQEDMIDKYLEPGDMFALYDDDLKSVCVVVAIDDETCELKNIATNDKSRSQRTTSSPKRNTIIRSNILMKFDILLCE